MKSINEAMKKLQESKRISLKEANEIATFELDWANEDIANMENDQEKELTLIKNVENTLKTNKIGAKVEIVSIDGYDFGGWPVVKVTGPKEDLAKNIGLYYLDNNEDEIDYNDIYDTYLENKELKEAEPTKLDDIVKVDPNKKEITYPKQDKNDPRKPSDITKDELLNSDKNEKELPSTENGTAKKEIQDMLDRSWNRKYNIGIENEEYCKNIEEEKCANCEESKIIKEDTEFYTDEALKVLDYIQNEMTNEQRKKLFIDECGNFEFNNEADQLKEFWDWIELLDSDDIEELGNKLNIIEEPEYQSDKELEMRKINESDNEITLDDIADKASELGYEILGDERDDEGLTILVYKPESAETDNFDDFDNEELYSYLSTIPNVKYQIDNDDQSCLAIWLKESKVIKESNDLKEKDTTDILREIEEWYKNYSSSNAFYEDLSNIIDYNKLMNWYKSL